MFFKKKTSRTVITDVKALKKINIPYFVIGNFFTVDVPFKLYIDTTGSRMTVGENVSFRSFCNLLLYSNSDLQIGKNVFFNNYCSINCLGKIEIGENCLFGEGVKIYDHNHAYGFFGDTLKVEREKFTIGSVTIGRDCWIGSNVTILNNVTIGNNVVIGANCFIHKSIPDNVVVKQQSGLIIEERKE